MVKFYFLTFRLFEKSVLALRACLNGAWLGVLRHEQLHQIDGQYYSERTGTYTDPAWNTRGLLPWERRAIEAEFSGCRTLLLTSLGGGRELLALSQMGYRVDGFECHPELLECARALGQSHGLASRIVAAERDACPDFEALYDGIVVGWGSYMLIQGRARRVQFLKRLRAHVSESAPILLSFYARTSDGLYFQMVRRVGNMLRRLRREERLELGDDLAPNYVHYFSAREIALELGAAGFQLTSFSTANYGHAVGRAVVVASARPEPARAHAATTGSAA